LCEPLSDVRAGHLVDAELMQGAKICRAEQIQLRNTQAACPIVAFHDLLFFVSNVGIDGGPEGDFPRHASRILLGDRIGAKCHLGEDFGCLLPRLIDVKFGKIAELYLSLLLAEPILNDPTALDCPVSIEARLKAEALERRVPP